MENINERVFAYSIAKVIEHDDVTKLSGSWHHGSHKITTSSFRHVKGGEAPLDIVLD